MGDQNSPVVLRYTGAVDQVPLLVESTAEDDGAPVMVPADPPMTRAVPRETLASVPPKDLTQADIDGLDQWSRQELEAHVKAGGRLYTPVSKATAGAAPPAAQTQSNAPAPPAAQ